MRDAVFVALGAWNATNTAVVIAAAITGGAAVIASLIAYRRSRRAPTPVPAPPIVGPSPLASFSGTQNEFTELVMKDNADLRSQLGGLALDVRGIKTDLADERAAANAYRSAMRRYLAKILAAWGIAPTMPLPDGDDFDLLSQTLPNFTRPGK